MDDIDASTSSSPLSSLHRLEFILQHQADQLLRSGLGIGFGQIRIMDELDKSSARSQREVAQKLYQTEANISRQLRLLKKQGLVSINHKPEDKRQRQVTLTDKGAKIYSQAQEILKKLHDDLLSSLEYRESYNLSETIKKLLEKL